MVAFSQLELAKSYEQKGEYETALEYYKKAYKKNANSDHYLPYYQCLLRLEQFAKAEKLAKKYHQKSGDPLVKIDQINALRLLGDSKEYKEESKALIKGLRANAPLIIKFGRRALQHKDYDLATVIYLKGRTDLAEEYPFCFELAEVYEAQGKYQKMIDEVLFSLQYGPSYLDGVKNALGTFLYGDTNGKKRKQLEMIVLKKVQKNQDNISYMELLIWLYEQDSEFGKAIMYAKSLDKRFDEDGFRIYELGELAKENRDYPAAIKAYEYLMAEKANSYFGRKSRVAMMDVLKMKLEKDKKRDIKEVLKLEEAYKKTLSQIKITKESVRLYRDLAQVLAFYKGEPNEALEVLSVAQQKIQLNPLEKAKFKIMEGDIYILQGDIWEASLLYGQVNQDFKNAPIGYEAKLKAAKAYYYTGNFEWAKTHLDVLKAATSKLIANDALLLSVLISDNLGLDTNEVALQMYAQADLWYYQQNLDSALFQVDQLIGSFFDHPSLLDDAYFLRGKILEEKGFFDQAIEAYSKVVAYDDLLADEALINLGRIYWDEKADAEKAMEAFEKILMLHEGSVHTVQARKSYRHIRKKSAKSNLETVD